MWNCTVRVLFEMIMIICLHQTENASASFQSRNRPCIISLWNLCIFSLLCTLYIILFSTIFSCLRYNYLYWMILATRMEFYTWYISALDWYSTCNLYYGRPIHICSLLLTMDLWYYHFHFLFSRCLGFFCSLLCFTSSLCPFIIFSFIRKVLYSYDQSRRRHAVSTFVPIRKCAQRDFHPSSWHPSVQLRWGLHP